jgi:hypothetical protein
MRLGMAALLIAGSAGLAGCTAVPGGGGVAGTGGYGYGYDAVSGPIYGYGGPSYGGVPTFSGGGYPAGPGWYRGDDGDWRQRAWRSGGAHPQQAERQLQEQRNAVLLRQQALQNQAAYQRQVQENSVKYQQQVLQNQAIVQENRMRAIQQGQEAQAVYQRQRLEAQQKKALGQQ